MRNDSPTRASSTTHRDRLAGITAACKHGGGPGRTVCCGMTHQRLGRQPDLFAPQTDLFDGGSVMSFEPPPADFVQRIRSELVETLALVLAATGLPWPDLTQATLAELRFNSIAGWLPQDEAERLRRDFATELARLYEAAGV